MMDDLRYLFFSFFFGGGGWSSSRWLFGTQLVVWSRSEVGGRAARVLGVASKATRNNRARDML